MQALIVSMALALAFAAAMLAPGWRLKQALKRPMPASFIAILRRNVPIYPRMTAPLQAQLHKLVLQFLHQKKFVGCEGQPIDDEVRITIAGQACLLLLNRATRVYPALDTVLVYPSAFLVPHNQIDAAGVVTETRQDLLGESWGDGRVVLSWDHVKQGARDGTDGQNVVLHEFAHQLDSESGSNNGAPYLGSAARYRRWSAVLSRDFSHLQAAAMRQQHGVLDHYGATSPAEFFAVATETFFEQPYQMAECHPALFAQFEQYYRVDPRAWQAAPAAAEAAPDRGRGQWQ